MIVDAISGLRQSGKTSLIRSLAATSHGLEEFFLLPRNECIPVASVEAFERRGRRGSSARWPVFATIDDDLQGQIQAIAATHGPQRLIIESPNAAALPRVLEAVRRVSIEGLVRRIRRILVIDGATFGKYYASSTRLLEWQIEVSDVVVVNKCDLVEPREALWIQELAGRVNPEARLMLATFGNVDGKEFRTEVGLARAEQEGQELERCTSAFTGSFDPDALLVLFQEFKTTALGDVARAKGVFRTADGWVQLDYTNGEVTVQRAADCAISRIAIIGNDIDRTMLGNRLNTCLL
ncbi:MAG: GTP-binding protein [Chloroflexi bacterium]|nr:GTP-binding protein [Chloroflexota bacterium]